MIRFMNDMKDEQERLVVAVKDVLDSRYYEVLYVTAKTHVTKEGESTDSYYLDALAVQHSGKSAMVEHINIHIFNGEVFKSNTNCYITEAINEAIKAL